MPDDKKKTDETAFQAAVTENSMKLIDESLRLADENAVIAIASLVIAAGRAAALSGLPLGIQLNLFASQHDMMLELLRKRSAENTAVTPTEVPSDIRKRTIN